MGTAARDAVLAEIRAHGPISFATYMELALYGPGGYYERPRVGPGGDFVTSPHVHPLFAELLARAIRSLWDELDRPLPLRIVEVGGGDGTLASQLLVSPAMPRGDYLAIERGPGARDALRARGIAVAERLPDHPHVVLAHELLDNLPFRRIRMTGDGLREVRVGERAGRLREVLTTVDPAATRGTGDLAEGEEAVIPVGASAFVDQLGSALSSPDVPGYAVIVDYGAEGSAGGPVHGYRGHRVLADLLDAPGDTDITAGVDLDRIAERAADAGLTPFPPVTQRAALMTLGFEEEARDLLARQHAQLDARDGAASVRTWDERQRAQLLVDPRALGRMHWLLLASPGLPAPPWLNDAAERDRA